VSPTERFNPNLVDLKVTADDQGGPPPPVDETADEGAVSDSTWETLAEDLQESELIELLMLIGHYMMLTTVLGSLRLQLEPRAEALARRVPGGPAA